MNEILNRLSTKYALHPNLNVKQNYDNTLPEGNLSAFVSDSVLKIDFLKFLKNKQFYQF